MSNSDEELSSELDNNLTERELYLKRRRFPRIFWKIVEHKTDLKTLYYPYDNLKVDLEKNLPNLIEKNPGLEEIKISFFSEVSDFNTKFLNEALQKVKLQNFTMIYDNNEDDTEEEIVKKFNFLPIFHCLENCEISELRFERISLDSLKFKSLEKMKNLENITIIQGWINEIPSNSLLFVSKLYLGIDSFSNHELIYPFLKCFPNLEELYLNTQTVIDCLNLKDSLHGIKLKSLIILNVTDLINEQSLTDVLKNITDFISLAEYGILKNFPFFTYLKDNQVLKKLEIGVGNFTDFDKFLTNNQKLKELKIFSSLDNKMKEEIIIKGFSQNHSIETLHFHLQKYFNPIMKGLMKNITLKNLILSGLENQDCIILGEFLLRNNSLKTLDLTYNNFQDSGFKIIVEALKLNQTLESLSIGTKMKECELLKDLFINNQTLRKIKLGEIVSKYHDFCLILEGLILNHSIKYLKLQCSHQCNFSEKELEEIGKILFFNQDLIQLNFNKDLGLYIPYILKRNLSFIKTLKIDKGYFKDLKIYFE